MRIQKGSNHIYVNQPKDIAELADIGGVFDTTKKRWVFSLDLEAEVNSYVRKYHRAYSDSELSDSDTEEGRKHHSSDSSDLEAENIPPLVRSKLEEARGKERVVECRGGRCTLQPLKSENEERVECRGGRCTLVEKKTRSPYASSSSGSSAYSSSSDDGFPSPSFNRKKYTQSEFQAEQRRLRQATFRH
jgi:hypothetical protein